jgi:hypothetical protein
MATGAERPCASSSDGAARWKGWVTAPRPGVQEPCRHFRRFWTVPRPSLDVFHVDADDTTMSGSNENSAKPAPRAAGPSVGSPLANAPRSPIPTGLEQTVLPSVAPASRVTNEDVTDPLLGTVVAGRYRLEALLGVGGMGRVYRAEHVYMRKLFALKVLHGHMTLVPEVVARFEREAIAAARVEHPNVAKASDFGCLEDGAFYLALEFVEGTSLRAEIHRCGTFTVARAVDIALQIASALTAAHAEGIVHRDLKPENVMLITQGGRKDRVKVLDFGIAKLQAEDRQNASKLTQVGSVFGTPEYMSPEQAMGQPVDARSDLYSVGIILYEMLAGHTPFAGGNMAAVLTRQMTAEAPPLSGGIPSGLRSLVTTLLSKPADERVPSAQELCRRLESLGLSRLPPPWARRAGSASSRAWAALVAQGGAWEGRLDRALLALAERVPRLSFLARPVPMPGRSIRLGLLVFAAALLVLVVAVVRGLSGPGGGVEQAAPARGDPTPIASRPTSAVSVVPAPPATVPRHLVEDIVATPVYKRTLQDWLALGRGQAQNGDWAESVAAYRNALQLRGSLKNDPKLLYDLRRAAEHPDAYPAAVGVATTRLGTAGMDLLYDLWEATKDAASQRPMAELAHRKLEILRLRKTSKSLRVRLELEFDRRCPRLEKTIRSAMSHADRRSLPLLESMRIRTGCGASRQRDCFECLRGNTDLETAIATARRTPAPVFDGKTPVP